MVRRVNLVVSVSRSVWREEGSEAQEGRGEKNKKNKAAAFLVIVS